jgi:sec-independent protein translocase protein TatA
MISTPVFALAIPGLSGIGMPELLIVLVVVLILFGPKRLPALGKSIGKTFRSLKDGIEGKLDEGEDAPAVEDASAKKAEPASTEAKKPAASEDKPSASDSDDA